MHDSANAGRRSIAILMQGGQVTLHQSSPAGVSGMQFSKEALAESAPRNLGSKRDVVSKQACSGNHIPESALKLGCGFPSRSLPETASHLEGQNWDAISGPDIKTKLRWNSCCLRLQPAKTGTIPPQLMGGNARAGNRSHLRGLGGRSQRHVIETHTSYGLPNSTDTRYPPAHQAVALEAVLDNRRDAGKVQIQRNDCHDNDYCRDQLIVQVRKHRLAATSLAQHVNGNGRGK